MTPAVLALVVLLTPLVSAAVIACWLRRAGGAAAFVSVLAATVVAVGGLTLALGGSRFEVQTEWFRVAGFQLELGIKLDDLAALMLSIVGIVGLCVHVFSLGYMHDDAARGRYFGGLSLFMFSMLGIVFADNLFMMFIFWELVGVSSYILINHWFQRPAAAEAGKKAFIVNRVGDLGFLLGIIMCYWANGTVNLTALGAGTHVYSRLIPLLLFCGAVGKSAQIPLQVWLPDAMEGPTPVSALIHAATMVAAGIYMLCRIQVLMVPDALTVIMWIGTATALYSALCAIVQSDIKKVLAYSTLSQLGFMVAAFGLGSQVVPEDGRTLLVATGVGAAMFHLTTHAFFKALMFLGSGSVIHGCHHEQNIFQMGGLNGRMRLTFVTFTIGVLAISGFPLLAGFFSKDAILSLAYMNNRAVFVILAVAAVLTALYMVRMWRLVFFGTPRSDNADHAHEGGPSFTLPLVVLALLAVLGGYTHIYPHGFEGVWHLIPEARGSAHGIVLGTSLVVTALGGLLGWILYPPAESDALAASSPGVFGALVGLQRSFDTVYSFYVAKVQQRLAMLLNFLEQIFLAGLIVRGFAGIVQLFGLGAQRLHVGKISVYLYWFLLGTVVLWAVAAGFLTF